MAFQTDQRRITSVGADLGGGEEGVAAQATRNKDINNMIAQVQERARMGAQLAGRGFAQQRDIATSAGLTLPQASQMVTNRDNYSHSIDEMQKQYTAFGQHEPFFDNMDQMTQMTGRDIATKYQSMTPMQQRVAAMGARAAGGVSVPFNKGFQTNLLLIQQQRLREKSMYAFV